MTESQSAAVDELRTLAATGELAAARAALASLRAKGLPEEDFQWIDLELDSFDKPAELVLAKAETLNFNDPERRTHRNYTKAEMLAMPHIGRPNEAIRLLRETLKEAPEYLIPSVATLLGWLTWRYRSPREAIKALKEPWIKCHYEPGSYLALFLACLNRVEEAKAVLAPIDQELLSENPNTYHLVHRLIEFKEQRSIGGALALAKAAEVMKTYSAPALIEAAQALMWAKRRDEAIDLLNQAVQVDPHYDQAYALLAEIALRRLKIREAMQHIAAPRHWNYKRLLKTSRD